MEHAFPDEIQRGCATYYGVPMQQIGEDGEVVLILGHHDAKRAVAALNRFFRDDLGVVLSDTYADMRDLLETRWARLLTECVLAQGPYHRDDCQICYAIRATIRDGGWWVGYRFTEQDASVFPVMVWSE